MHAGRQAERQASRTNLERISNASRTKMRAPVSRKAGISNESRTHPERIPYDNEISRIYM